MSKSGYYTQGINRYAKFIVQEESLPLIAEIFLPKKKKTEAIPNDFDLFFHNLSMISGSTFELLCHCRIFWLA